MNQIKMNKLKKIIIGKFEGRVNADFGWLNFLSGIMISSSINTLTGFCTSNDTSIFVFFVSVFSGLSSGFFFALYQSLTKVRNKVEGEIERYSSSLTPRDLYTHRNIVWNKLISEEINPIFVQSLWAGITGILSLIGLFICYYDSNPELFFH